LGDTCPSHEPSQPALSISFLTVAKRLYLVILRFFSLVFGGLKRLLATLKTGREKAPLATSFPTGQLYRAAIAR
jgi:hypothetical protein